MSATGHRGDDVETEGFFDKLERGRGNLRRYRTVGEAQADACDYIERFHDPRIERRIDSLQVEESA